jgi:hypothetical protein
VFPLTYPPSHPEREKKLNILDERKVFFHKNAFVAHLSHSLRDGGHHNIFENKYPTHSVTEGTIIFLKTNIPITP